MEKCQICGECKKDVFVTVFGTYCEDCFEEIELYD
jgi:hypothetical protein